ncbi:hypothetical protein [Arthrobacter woluwensis]|uniref:Uncharacterized protein n=1 Tax=Arthrobacter woluwensis TaxID=156980 RepID=A0A1H4WEA3_9MICC|nr:hypothetical protein [Arthrobacter woluwensis]SEC91410.1 hypothetical protein SAMN04489745_3501 [Arthrobacter woluwensis]
MRFIICDLITGTVLDEAPLVIAEDLTRQLKGVGEGKFFAPFFDGEGRLYKSRYWEKLIVPWKSLILVTDEDGRIIWHGIPNSTATPGINGQEIPAGPWRNTFCAGTCPPPSSLTSTRPTSSPP